MVHVACTGRTDVYVSFGLENMKKRHRPEHPSGNIVWYRNRQ